MSFVTPKWDSENSHYTIDVIPAFSLSTAVPIGRDNHRNTIFTDSDALLNVTDRILNNLITEGEQGKWLSLIHI